MVQAQLPDVPVHVVEPPVIRLKTADLDVFVSSSIVAPVLGKLVHHNFVDGDFAIRPGAAGVLPLNLCRQVEVEFDSLA